MKIGYRLSNDARCENKLLVTKAYALC